MEDHYEIFSFIYKKDSAICIKATFLCAGRFRNVYDFPAFRTGRRNQRTVELKSQQENRHYRRPSSG